MLALVGFVGLCLLAGAADTAFVRDGGWAWYLSLKTPPAAPPDWLFAPVWTALHLAIGTAAWLVWRRVGAGPALRLWGWQIAANAFWTPAFFGLHQLALALGVNLVLLALTALTTRSFARLVPIAGWLMLPCLAWTTYATYLAIEFWWLNGV